MIKDSDIESNITSRYIKFINRFFDLWFKYRDKIIVREFEQIIHKLIIGRKFKARLPLEQSLKFDIITIGIGGELYYFSPDLITGISTNQKEFMIGSIFDIEDFDNLITNEKFQKIYQAINSGIRNCKRTCEYFDICGGGEPADKLYGAGSFDATQTLTCKLRKKVTCDVISKKINIDESNFA